tara:strand:+ start:205 stop:1422 length:1218 start_codon:yes stop_codon:yes gene_type:complete
MENFIYKAIDQSGKKIDGQVAADDDRSASRQLRQRGYRVLELSSKAGKSVDVDMKSLINFLINIRPISTTDKIFFFRQVSLMLRSGLSLTEALANVESIMSGRISIIVKEINFKVQSGETFSKAISQASGIFPEMASHMIGSAEASGQLDIVMERLADHMERQSDLKRDTLTTLLYPGITLIIGIGMFFFLSTVVVPKFAKFFTDSGKTMPAQTQSLVDFANFLSQWWMLIFFIVAGIFSLLVYYYRTPSGRLKMDKIFLKLPVVGSIILISSMSQISWSLSMLLRSGLTVVQALDILKNIVSNKVLSNDLIVARQRILQGQDLTTSLAGGNISPLIQQLASIGEKSGSLTSIMEEAGQFYESALQAKNKLLSSLVEPVAIVLIGGMVAYIYIAFFKAIFAVSGG